MSSLKEVNSVVSYNILKNWVDFISLSFSEKHMLVHAKNVFMFKAQKTQQI